MAVYTGQTCPVCSKKFRDEDDVVVCPICGAPHHRECYRELGHCAYEDKHGKQQSYKRPDESAYDGYASLRCSRCGTVNPAGHLFCQVCGNPLNEDQPQQKADAHVPQEPFYQMPYNPFVNPFGGVDPEELIDEIPAKDIALFVGESSFYFLPKFKEMQGRLKARTVNWASFFFQAYYFLYRKMYLWAAVIFVATTALSIPSLYAMTITYADVFGWSIGIENPQNVLNYLYTWQTACSVVSLALRIGLAFLFNPLYKNHVIGSVRRIKGQGYSENEYHAALAKKGGVSRLAVGIVLGALMVLSFVFVYLMTFLSM